MAAIPNDPMMLLSYINTKLRDEYKNLSELCDDLELSFCVIVTHLEKSSSFQIPQPSCNIHGYKMPAIFHD